MSKDTIIEVRKVKEDHGNGLEVEDMQLKVSATPTELLQAAYMLINTTAEALELTYEEVLGGLALVQEDNK